MKQAIGAYQHVSASSELKELERLRAKARHDEALADKDAHIGELRVVGREMTTCSTSPGGASPHLLLVYFAYSCKFIRLT